MISESLQQHLETELEKITYRNSKIIDIIPVSGGSINQCFQLKTRFDSFFIKMNTKGKFPFMFENEVKGLDLIRKSNAFYLPEVLMQQEFDDHTILVMEFIHSKPKTNNFWEDFAERLAKLHQRQNDDFGLEYDNYMV